MADRTDRAPLEPGAVLRTRRLPLSPAEAAVARPLFVVWEMTLRCDQRCTFCGTRAGRAAENELDTAEALDVIEQLAELGTREVAVHGGEAYLRSDWLELVKAIRRRDMLCTMVTGGLGVTPALAEQAAAAGLSAVSVSVDGRPTNHDALRGRRGSYDRALAAMEAFASAGVRVGCNTQLNRANFRELDYLTELVTSRSLYGWQIQLMVPMGRAADSEELWLQPYDLLEIMPLIARARPRCDEAGVALWPGNNVGYFGPFEALLRGGRMPGGHSTGCGGGVFTMGIEADGGIKGCSAMATEGFVGGNVREAPIREIWEKAPELMFTRRFDRGALWGFCADCYYAEVCKSGCVWTASTLLGRAGNNPYCHHRALELLARGQRERLHRIEEAPGERRDTALFEVREEEAPGAWVQGLPEQRVASVE